MQASRGVAGAASLVLRGDNQPRPTRPFLCVVSCFFIRAAAQLLSNFWRWGGVLPISRVGKLVVGVEARFISTSSVYFEGGEAG